MSHPTARGIASAAAVLIALIFFLWGFERLLMLGGSPEERGTATHYRIKPMMRIVGWILMLAGSGAIWSGNGDVQANRTSSSVILIVVGAIAAIGGVFVALGQYEIILDPAGIRYHSLWCRDIVILWNDLSHFEKLYNGRALTTNYFIRSETGVTIAAGDSSFDTTDLLRRIQARHALPEKPYKRRKWYGG